MAAKIVFQAKALEKLSSPDELDHLLRVVNLRSWLSLSVLSLCVVLALVWGVWGRIPVTVTGSGVLVSPGNVRGIQSQASGQLVEFPTEAVSSLRSLVCRTPILTVDYAIRLRDRGPADVYGLQVPRKATAQWRSG